MKSWQVVTISAACAFLPVVSALAQTTASSPAAAWYVVGHVDLRAADAENALTASWQFDRADNGDIRILKDEQRATEKISGSVFSLCEDRALAFKGIVPAARQELAELDQPVLLLQLALKLLARALPQGPQSVTAPGTTELADTANPLRVAKGPNVRRDFGAPWQAQVHTDGAGNGDIKFDTHLSYSATDTQKKSEIKLTGVWRQASAVRVWDNDTPLKGQRIYRVEKAVVFVGGNALLQPELLPQVFEFDTLGLLRARIEHNWDPNPKAPQRLICGL